ncbi:Serine protease Do-like HtrB [compost metagenome]
MSLFDDDFYSTKTSKPNPWKDKGWSSGSSLTDRKLYVILLSGLGGALIMLLLVWMIGAGKEERIYAGEVIPAGLSADSKPVINSDPIIRATERIKPTVVSVITSKKEEKAQTPGSGVGIGSGVIFQKNGDKALVVTNNHVVEGGTQFEVVTYQGEHRKATLIGKDNITDLAVLEIDSAGLKSFAEFGDSDSLQAGETVIALGNPLGLGYSPSVTKGIVSLPKRTIPVSIGGEGDYNWEMDVIQTDAAINQGNSGGPLVNQDGKVVGINTLKIADMGVEGLGFAIPINEAKPIIETLIKDHKVKRPLLGVSTQELQSFTGTDILKLPADVKTGVIVFEVSGPSKEAGLKAQDVIVQLDDQKINSTITLRKYLYQQKKVGDKVKVTYYRGGKKLDVTVVLAEVGEK